MRITVRVLGVYSGRIDDGVYARLTQVVGIVDDGSGNAAEAATNVGYHHVTYGEVGA